ncbi:MAG TPA: class I SAM-dependent methyltransferase [Acidimicrobiales bacterium]|nr:class I SAM-dependent methyltransferase [Acidimicrobiales bacterium]
MPTWLGRGRRTRVSGAIPAAPAAPAPPVQHVTHALAQWPAFPPAGYLGQLEDSFQHRVAGERYGVAREDCDFYHTSVLRSGEVIPGPWDLRGNESEYLGHVPLAGRRVLELGPASGYLSFHMEDAGAEVVAFDAGYDVSVNLLPEPGTDMVWMQTDFMRMINRVQNAWWFLHRDRQSKVRVAYGDIYNLPGDLGTFDVALFGSILLHLRDPFRALQQAAVRTTGTMIVTDAIQDTSLPRDDTVMRWAPAKLTNLSVWWILTPGAVEQMLTHLGFTRQRRIMHTQTHHLGHDMGAEPIKMEMFTVVGEREQ